MDIFQQLHNIIVFLNHDITYKKIEYYFALVATIIVENFFITISKKKSFHDVLGSEISSELVNSRLKP